MLLVLPTELLPFLSWRRLSSSLKQFCCTSFKISI
jgi:hypothetical protein